MQTFGQLLINQDLPEEYKFRNVAGKKEIYTNLTAMAKKSPHIYGDKVHQLKKVGDFFATNQGISVGLDDIEPDYAKRDDIIRRAKKDLRKLKTYRARQERIVRAQEEGLALAKKHHGSLTHMAESGGRGSYGQLLKTLVAPISTKGADDTPTDFLMSKSYSEGVSPSEMWMGATEARREVVKAKISVSAPGDAAKQLVNVLHKVIVTKEDCGTKNGLQMDTNDHNIIGRFTAGDNVLITDQNVSSFIRRGKSIKVRSPMTCEAQPGVCQKCYGVGSNEKLLDIGTNYGTRAAQAMSEPLTQMVLSSLHGGNVAKIGADLPLGMAGFQQIVGIPKVFKNESTLALKEGRVTNVDKMPHGGYTVMVGGQEHFVAPGRRVVVKRGDYIGKGEKISDGVPNPKDVTSLRGFGSGRKYLVDTLHKVYEDSGVNMDKRNIETLVREDLNYVKAKKSDSDGRFLKHDIVPFNTIKPMIQKTAKRVPFNKSIIGKTLGEDYTHFTTGTKISPEMYSVMSKDPSHRPDAIAISNEEPMYTPVVTAMERVPTMSQDVVGRLAHRRLKDSLMEGATKGYETKIEQSPFAQYVFGGF